MQAAALPGSLPAHAAAVPAPYCDTPNSKDSLFTVAGLLAQPTKATPITQAGKVYGKQARALK